MQEQQAQPPDNIKAYIGDYCIHKANPLEGFERSIVVAMVDMWQKLTTLQQSQQAGKILRWVKGSEWPAKLTGERIGKTNYKRHVLVTVLKNGTADWRNSEYEDEKVEFILLESAEYLSSPASPIEEKYFVKWLDQERNRENGDIWKSVEIWSKLNAFELVYDIFRKQMGLTSPIIEIGEPGKLPVEEFKRIAEQADKNNFYRASGQRNGFETGYKMGASHEYLRKASHPAPAPIVGERGPNLTEIEEDVANVLDAETDESLREWHDKQPKSAATEQALPEEIKKLAENPETPEHYEFGQISAYDKGWEDGVIASYKKLTEIMDLLSQHYIHPTKESVEFAHNILDKKDDDIQPLSGSFFLGDSTVYGADFSSKNSHPTSKVHKEVVLPLVLQGDFENHTRDKSTEESLEWLKDQKDPLWIEFRTGALQLYYKSEQEIRNLKQKIKELQDWHDSHC